MISGRTTGRTVRGDGACKTVVLLSHKKPDVTYQRKAEFGEGEEKLHLIILAKSGRLASPKKSDHKMERST